MMPTWVGYFVFAAIFGLLAVVSVLREREVPAKGEFGRPPRGGIPAARVLSGVLVLLMVLAAAVVIVRFQQIAIWE